VVTHRRERSFECVFPEQKIETIRIDHIASGGGVGNALKSIGERETGTADLEHLSQKKRVFRQWREGALRNCSGREVEGGQHGSHRFNFSSARGILAELVSLEPRLSAETAKRSGAAAGEPPRI
jgi:hypothetical protein